jgi:hypothetical protein
VIRFRLAALILLVPPASMAPAQVSGCAGAEYRQFDFWIGEWAVTDRVTGKPAGSSHIEKLYGGCVLRENYAAGSFRGGSLNSYWRGDRKWHQTWMDSAGAFRHFVGGLDTKGRMVMTAEQPNSGKTRLVRLTFTANPDGTVRQYSDLSDDGGRSWSLRYDYLYRPLAR